MTPRSRKTENRHLAKYPGLGLWANGTYYFQNPVTGRQKSLKTKDLKQATVRWAIAKALCDKEHGDLVAAKLAESIQESTRPLSRGPNIYLCDFIHQWRTEVLEAGLVKVKIKRDQGKPLSERTRRDYANLALQLETSPAARFPVATRAPLTPIRKLLSPWATKPTHYNHLKAVLGRVFDHAVLVGLVEKNPMRDIEKLAVARREVLIPDDAYIAITDRLATHELNRRKLDGTWRMMICDLFYMMSQQPVDLFSLRVDQIHLDAGEHGEIHLARAKTKVAGIIAMNAEMRAVVDWLLAFRDRELGKRRNRFEKPPQNLLIYPAYMDKRSRLKPVLHRTFSLWWSAAAREAGFPGMYRLMDLRKKGLTDEFVAQGDNDKGLHETDAMKRHYRLITPPKRSQNTLVSIRDRAKMGAVITGK